MSLRMNGFRLAILALFALPLASSTARAEWVRYEDYKVSIDAPKDWKVATDLFGVPITVLGPQRGKDRAVFLVQHTKVTDITFVKETLNVDNTDYLNARKEWLAKLDGSEFIQPLAPRMISNPSTSLNGVDFGFQYKLRGIFFEEHNVRVSCGARFLFLENSF